MVSRKNTVATESENGGRGLVVSVLHDISKTVVRMKDVSLLLGEVLTRVEIMGCVLMFLGMLATQVGLFRRQRRRG